MLDACIILYKNTAYKCKMSKSEMLLGMWMFLSYRGISDSFRRVLVANMSDGAKSLICVAYNGNTFTIHGRTQCTDVSVK